MKKNKKHFEISVGISAFNEEGTIGTVIDSILEQKQNGWKLKEVLVYSDGSNDKTCDIAKDKSKLFVKVFDFNTRKGKTYRLNQILKKFRGDILIIFDADIGISDRYVISNMIEEFKKDKNVKLVGGNSRNYQPKSFFENAISSSYYVYFKSRDEIKGGNNVYACTGACLSLARDFAKRLVIPKDVINDDTFFYFSCITMGFKFRYAKKAIVYFRLASNIKDFLRQMFRNHPEAINAKYKKYFGDLIDKEYKRSRTFYLKKILEAFTNNPTGTLFMVLLKICMKPFYPYFSKNYKLSWFTAKSTKKELIYYSGESL